MHEVPFIIDREKIGTCYIGYSDHNSDFKRLGVFSDIRVSVHGREARPSVCIFSTNLNAESYCASTLVNARTASFPIPLKLTREFRLEPLNA
jgi:hypothetical protein